MSNNLSISRGRMLAIGALFAVVAATLFATQLSATSDAAAKKAQPPTINMRVLKSNAGKLYMDFTGPQTIRRGQYLRIVNRTNPRAVGPHTFSLVPKYLHPDTQREGRTCFNGPGKICFEISRWHKIEGEGEVIGENPAKAGRAGWDREGTLKRKGDSWFSQREDSSFGQRVTAPVGTNLSYLCAIHPNMQGNIRVVR